MEDQKQSTRLENCTERAQEAADSQNPIVIPSVRVAEKLSRKKSERFTYLVAAVMSSFGITSMAVIVDDWLKNSQKQNCFRLADILRCFRLADKLETN
ncbi:hypothetical protein L3X38_001595 [Prunus dulcis]|uniref:beta-carotene 3-hydroxylase n=1 Tax=Prunus dulcis TaxID=3755 RepID=A0AAD4WSC4_PRUDU|nr:hypothetical protein L3X38_001595 [Prunus dulcis]